MENLNITLIQTHLTWENPVENRAYFSKKIEQIKEHTDLILLPEMFSTGFSMESKPLAENPQGPTLNWMQKTARDNDAAVCGSLIVKENNNYFNRLYFVYPDGQYKTYDKRHLFSFAGEHKAYSPGSSKLIINYKSWKICPLICYDLRFPIWARNVENYDLLLYIANWPDIRISSWDTLLKARSIENICFTAGLNRIGSDPNDNNYNGHSAIYNPIGEKLTVKNWEQEFVHTFSLEKKSISRFRKKFPFLKDRDQFEVKR